MVHGKHDPIIALKDAHKMHQLIPNSKLEIISKMRHLIEPEILELFQESLLEHLMQNA